MKLFLTTCVLAAAASLCNAQPLRFYSEFRRVGPDGTIVRADATGEPREIISPAVLKGMHLSYRIVVETPIGVNYWMYVGANPEDLIESVLYREKTVAGVPTGMQEVKLPINGSMTAEKKVDTYWLDLYIPKTTPARRIRFEAQLNFNDRWVIYPLEVRVMEGEAVSNNPDFAPTATTTRSAPISDITRTTLAPFLCGITVKPTAAKPAAAGLTEPSQSEFVARNAAQDLTLAKMLEAKHGHDAVVKGMLTALGAADAKTWCAPARKPYDPDSLLRARDYLIRGLTPQTE